MQIPFVGPTYQGRSTAVDATRCINFFPETNAQDSKAVVSLTGRPGLRQFAYTRTTPVRGMRVFNNTLFVVVYNTLYTISTGGVLSGAVGTLNTTSGHVDMADNGLSNPGGVGGNQLLIVDGSAGYIWNTATSTFSTVSTSGGFPTTPRRVCFIDGYFVVTDGSMSFHVSNIYDGTTWNSLATAAVAAASDTIQGVFNLHQQVWFIKQYSTEIWYDTGTPTINGSPFSRVAGAVLDYGTSAPWSVAHGADNLFFLADQRNNDGGEFIGVVMISSSTPNVISTPAISYMISQLSTVSDAIGYCAADQGHTFYVLTFPAGNMTLVYDLTTQMWHEWSTNIDGQPFQINRHIGNSYVKFNNLHLVGSSVDGTVYAMSSAYNTDFGNSIISIRRAQVIHDKNDLGNIFIHKLVVDAEGGVGNYNTPSAVLMPTVAAGQIQSVTITEAGWDYKTVPTIVIQGDGTGASIMATVAGGRIMGAVVNNHGSGYTWATIDISGPEVQPVALLSWSDDGGNTWSSEHPASLGNIGQYTTRLKWLALGKSRARTFQLKISDSVRKNVIGAYIEATS